MSHVVISSFENIDTGDLQAEGEAIAVFATEAAARAHVAQRASALAAAVSAARANDSSATFITWIVTLQMPLDVSSVEEALEDLELVLEESEAAEDPFADLVVAYEGHRHGPGVDADYPRSEALRGLEAWLS